MHIGRLVLVLATVLTLTVAPGRHVVALPSSPSADIVAGAFDHAPADHASADHTGAGHVRAGHAPSDRAPPGHDPGHLGYVTIAVCCGAPALPAGVVADYRAIGASVTWIGPAVVSRHGETLAPEPPPPRL